MERNGACSFGIIRPSTPSAPYSYSPQNPPPQRLDAPQVAGTNSPAYHTYIFGRGAFAYGESNAIQENEAAEVARDAFLNDTHLLSLRCFGTADTDVLPR